MESLVLLSVILSGAVVKGLTCIGLSTNSTKAEHNLAWTCEQINWRNALAEWKKIAEQECNVSDAEQYWRNTFKCPDFSAVTCLNEESQDNETDLFNCSITFCKDGMYEDDMAFLDIWRQHLTTHQAIMTIYKSKLINCGVHDCLNSDAITLEAWNAHNIKYFNLSALLSEAEERIRVVENSGADWDAQTQKISELSDALDTANARIKDLESQIEIQLVTIAQLSSAFNTSEDALIKLQQKVDSFSDTLNSTNTKLSDVEDDVIAYSQSYTTLSGALNTSNTKVTDLESDVSAQAQSYATLSGALNTSNSKIADLESDVTAQAQRYTTLLSALNTTNTKITDLESDVTAQAQSYATLSGALNTSNSKIADLESDVTAQAQSYATLLSALNIANTKIASLETDVSALTQKQSAFTSSLSSSDKRIQDLEDRDNQLTLMIMRHSKLQEISGRMYYFGETPKNWQDARQECRSMGGDLVAKGIRDSQTFDALYQRGVANGINYWIGLTDLIVEGRYEFVDGVIASTSDFYWNPGEPNDAGNDEDCSELRTEESGKVNDHICSILKSPLCEFDFP